MLRILTDSTCDLPETLIRRHRITVVPAYINSGTRSWRDEVELTRADFYRDLATYRPYPTTSAPPPAEFAGFYQEAAADGATEMISLHVAGSLSSIIDASRLGAAEADSGVPVHFVDSGQLSLGLGFQVLAAARLAEKGVKAQAIIARLAELQKRVVVYALIDSLDSLRRSGRVNWLQMRVGNLINLKLLLRVHQGKVESIGRVRTRTKAINALVEIVAAQGPYQQIAFLNTDAADFASFQHKITAVLSGREERFAAVAGPAIGAHVGSGALAVAVVSEPD